MHYDKIALSPAVSQGLHEVLWNNQVSLQKHQPTEHNNDSSVLVGKQIKKF